MSREMTFAASVQTVHEAGPCVDALLAETTPRIGPDDGDLITLFLTAHYEDELSDIVARLRQSYPRAVLIGCTAESIIGNALEIEGRPAMSMLVASLPGVEVHPFHVSHPQHARARASQNWEPLLGVCGESEPVILGMADPYRFDVLTFVEDINEALPGAPVLGGIASAADGPGQNALILDDAIHREGLVGVALTGDLRVDAVVSQGCRPIGRPFIVTKSQDRFIRELGGKVAWERLQEVIAELRPDEEQAAQQALFVGRAINEYKPDFKRGDFLIHTLLGVERNTGALAIAGMPRIGSTVQFHIRDAESADEDLRHMLAPFRGPQAPSVAGALLFSCNGRGSRMWPGVPHHDAGVLREHLGDVPTAGFFCAGEFGPVGGRNFVHGFTASIALFRPRGVESVPVT